MLNKLFKLNVIAASMSVLILSGCNDAETTIIEKESIETVEETEDSLTIESMGRLAVLSADTNDAVIFDLDDGDLLDTFSLTYDDNTLSASAGYRFAIIANRSNDYVGFIDGGLWREDHVEHLHDYEQAPVMSDFELTGSRPTHITQHETQTAFFFDGDADSGALASVQVVTDTDISSDATEIDTLSYDVNMHGVAKPNGEHLVTTVRRDDADSTSASKVLPDQVGVYHLHDGEYEQEQVFDITCPDLHGAAQNHEFIVFGCSDSVLVGYESTENDDEYVAEKIDNIDALSGVRIGALYAHEASESFIGTATAYGTSTLILVNVLPELGKMKELGWQPESDASPISYAFDNSGEHFLILDSKGFLNVLSSSEVDGEVTWELEQSLDISEEDIADMPDTASFSMTVAQNGHYVYVSDPIAKHVLQVNLETLEIDGDIEVDFVPKSLAWLGIAEEGDDHDHDH